MRNGIFHQLLHSSELSRSCTIALPSLLRPYNFVRLPAEGRGEVERAGTEADDDEAAAADERGEGGATEEEEGEEEKTGEGRTLQCESTRPRLRMWNFTVGRYAFSACSFAVSISTKDERKKQRTKNKR